MRGYFLVYSRGILAAFVQLVHEVRLDVYILHYWRFCSDWLRTYPRVDKISAVSADPFIWIGLNSLNVVKTILLIVVYVRVVQEYTARAVHHRVLHMLR